MSSHCLDTFQSKMPYRRHFGTLGEAVLAETGVLIVPEQLICKGNDSKSRKNTLRKAVLAEIICFLEAQRSVKASFS